MVTLKHPSGLVKEVPTGFSWTTFFFGAFVPLIRGWYSYAAIAVVAGMLTGGLAWFVYPFIINKHYAKFMLENGYVPSSELDMQKLVSMGVPVIAQAASSDVPAQQQESEAA